MRSPRGSATLTGHLLQGQSLRVQKRVWGDSSGKAPHACPPCGPTIILLSPFMNSELREGSPLALSQSLGQQGGVSPSDTLVHADELSVSVSGSPYPARPSPLLKATARATRLSSDCLACWGPRALLLRGGAGVENLTQSQRKTIQDKKNRVKEARHRGVRTVRFFTDVDSQTGKTNARWEEAQRW